MDNLWSTALIYVQLIELWSLKQTEMLNCFLFVVFAKGRERKEQERERREREKEIERERRERGEG